MPLNAYLKLTLKTQGKVAAGAKGKHGPLSFSDGIEIHGFEYGVTSPYDAGSGTLTGRRQHKPIIIIREVDSASPLLWHALVTNESFQSAVLTFARPSSSGAAVMYNTLELTNGQITNIGHSPSKGRRRREAITLIYQELKINGAPALFSGGLESRWGRIG